MNKKIFIGSCRIHLFVIAACFCNPSFSQGLDVGEIMQMLEDQNRMLGQQQKEIEAFKEQNKKLREMLSKYQRTEAESLRPSDPGIGADYNQVVEEADWGFSFTPRTALRFQTASDYSNEFFAQLDSEEPAFWTNGATFAVNTPWLPNTSFLFTALYGKDTGNFGVISTLPIDGGPTLGFPAKGRYNSELYDFELLARTFVPGTAFNWIIGAEYFEINQDLRITSGTPFFTGNKANNTSRVFIIKGGLGGFFNLSDDGSHRIFSNIMLVGALNEQSTLTTEETWLGFGGDVNIGYEWIINEGFSISPRYRGQFIYFDTENLTAEDQFFVIHGPELHFSVRF